MITAKLEKIYGKYNKQKYHFMNYIQYMKKYHRRKDFEKQTKMITKNAIMMKIMVMMIVT